MHSQFRNDSFEIVNIGVLTERLGNGLQNRVERFDSARHLLETGILLIKNSRFFYSHYSWYFTLSYLYFLLLNGTVLYKMLLLENILYKKREETNKMTRKQKLFAFYFFKPNIFSNFANVILNTIFLP